MAGQAGLGGAPQQGNQAGLADEPATMGDRFRLSRAMIQQGYSDADIRTALGMENAPANIPPGEEPEDRTVGMFGDLAYSTRSMLGNWASGAGEGLEDHLGWEGTGDALGALAEYVGPSEAQEQAQADEAAYRQEMVDSGQMSEAGQFAREAGDAILESTPAMVGVAAAGLAGGKAGAVAGATVGSILPGGGTAAGAFIGGLIGAAGGAIAASLPMMYEEQLQTAEKNGLSRDDPEVQKKALTGAAINTSMDVITPLKILGKINPGKAVSIAQGSVLKKGAKEAIKDAAFEGGTEVAQLATGAILFDENIEKLSKEDRAALVPYIAQTYGREIALNFIAGAGAGGVFGGAAGMRQQQLVNAKIKQSSEALSKAAETTGAPLEGLKEKAKTPEGAREIADAAAEIQLAEIRRENAKAIYDADPTPERKKVFRRIERDIDATYDRIMPTFGGRKLTEVRAEAEAVKKLETEGAFKRIKEMGLKPKADADPDAVISAAKRVEDATVELTQAEERLSVAGSPKSQARVRLQIEEGEKKLAKVKADAARAVGDSSVTEASILTERRKKADEREAVDGREKAVQRDTAANFPAWMSPEQKTARATQIIEAAKAKPDAELTAQLDKLTGKMSRALPGSPEQDRLQRQIDQLGTRMGGVSPAVEAARRVLQAGAGGSASGGAMGSSPGAVTPATEAAADVGAGEATKGAEAASREPGDGTRTEAAPGRDILRPRDIKPETLTRFATARAASAATPDLTPQTEAVARELLVEGGAEPTQANVDILVKTPGVIAKRLAQIAKGPQVSKAADTRLTAALKGGYAIDDGGPRAEWQHLIDVVDPGDDPVGVEQTLREWTATTGKEASATFDDAGNLLGAGTNNDPNGIMPPSNGWGTTATTMTHTHPDETSFSMADVMVLATSPALKASRVVTPTQTIEMRPTEALRATPSEDALYGMVRPIQDWLYDNLPFDTRVITPLSASRIQQEAQLRFLARQGVIEYTTPITGFTPVEEDYINGAIDAAAAKPEPRENDRGAAASREEGASSDGRDDTGSDRLSGRSPPSQARGRDPAYPEFHAAWRAGTRNEDLIQRPEFVLANGKMMTAPLTSRRPGFNTPQWHAERTYQIDGVEVKGTAAALDAFYAQAAALAANELRLPVRPLRNERILTIVTGPPASGKSTIANEIAYAQGAAILDSDEFKKALPEFGDGSGANAVHAESKAITDAMEELMLADGVNVVYPKVGHEAGSITKLGRRFKAEGYKVNFVNLDVPVDIAMNRMLGRFGMTGRLIPPSYLLEEVGDNPSRTHNEMERNGEFDGYAQLDGLTPYGRTPEVLSQTGNPLAGTKFSVPDGSSAQRGPAAAQPGNAGNTGRQAPQVSRGVDEALEAEGIGETRGVRGRARGDRAALKQLSTSVLSWAQAQPKKRGTPPPFLNLAQAGDLSVENLSKAIDALLSGIGASAGRAMMNAGEKLSPAAVGGQQTTLALGLGLTNAIARQGFGGFQRRDTLVWNAAQRQMATVSTFSVDEKLKDFLKIKKFGFLPPMSNPDDTSQIKLDGARNLMSGPALERAEATARMLQAQRYTIDQDAVAAIVADPGTLISKKSRGPNEVLSNSRAALTGRLTALQSRAAALTRADIKPVMPSGMSNHNLDKALTAIKDAAQALTLADIGYTASRGPLDVAAITRATTPLVNALSGVQAKGADPMNPVVRLSKAVARLSSDNLRGQLEIAKQKASRLRDYADGAVDREIGFRYGIDKKGRLYPDGEFHHQSGDVIKGVFRTVDGVSLADMESFDHTGSGWQIAALIARDEKIAARVNISGGMSTDPNPPKGDIYTGVVGKMVARIEQDIARGDAAAIWFRDTIMNPVIEERSPPGAPKTFAQLVRPDFKTPVIAVNYGGSDRQFTEALFAAFGDKLRNTEAPPSFWAYFQEVGGEAISSEAPAVIAFKEWAISALEQGVRAAVAKGINPETLTFTVGPDAKYTAVKKLLGKEKPITAEDASEGAAFPSVKVLIRETVAPDDPLKGIDYPKTAKNIFSQIIQGYDAAVMHDAVRRYREAVPTGFMATNHDSYTIPDENRLALAQAVNEALYAMIERGGNVGERLRQEILDQTGLDVGAPPAQGSYRLEDVLTSAPVWREGKDGADDTPMSVPAVSRGRDTLAERRTPDTVGQSGIQLTNSLAASFEQAATKAYRTGRELKLDLDARSRAAQAEQGIDLTTFTPENVNRLADFAVEDALEALQDNANAVGWYDSTVTRALAELEKLHPELKADKEARLKFIWALAVTSNGIKVNKNFQLANQAYEFSKASSGQTFPMGIGVGTAAKQIDSGLATYDTILAKLGSVDAVVQFMTTKMPVRDVERISGIGVSGEGKAELVYGAAILGPKIGNGFFSNLYGNFDALTMDRWLMRSVGRWRGNLLTINEPMILSRRAEIKETLKGATQAQLKYLNGFFNGTDIKLSKMMVPAKIDALAEEVAFRSMAKSWREAFASTPEGNALRLSGNALAKYLDGQNEAPSGAGERTFIRKVFGQALERLRAMPGNASMTMADLQALLWYPERRLYDAAKTSGDQQKGYDDDEAPDYANAARALVEDRLGSAGPGGPDGLGAGGAGPRAGQGSPQVSRGADGPDVRQRRAGGRDDGGVARPATTPEGVAGIKSVREFPDGRHVYETTLTAFSRRIAAAKATLGPIGAQVGEGAGDRQFLFDDGASGFALEGDNIISVFSTPGKSAKGAARRVLQAAVAEGGRRLDGFDTFLPDLYAANGFRAVARLPFNREYAPEGWNYGFFGKTFGNETPDVVFMVYDPSAPSPDTDRVIDDYDDGGRLQAEALALPQVSRGIDVREARIGQPPGPEVEFRLTNTSARPRERVADVRHNLTSYDRDAVLAAVIDRGRGGPAYAKVAEDAEALMTGWINGVRSPDKAAMLAAAAEHRRQKALGSFRPMDQRMATDIYREMGRLLAQGRMDEGDIARALGKTREQAAKIAAVARSAAAKGPQVSRGIDALFQRPRLTPAPAGASRRGLAPRASDMETPYAKAARAAKDGTLLRKMGRAIERQVFNQQAGLKQIERALGDDGLNLKDGMSRMAQMMTASSGRVAAMMQYGAPKWDADEKVFTYAEGTKGLTEIFQFESEGDYDAFQKWAFAKRDRGLRERGKGARMTDELLADYESIPAATKVRYNAMLADYRKFNEAMLDLMVDSGLITGESRAALSEDQEYVPMFRAFKDAAEFGMQDFFGKPEGFSHPDPGIRKLKQDAVKVGEKNGGDFGDLIEGIQSGAIAALHAAQQNIANAQIHDFMSGNLGHEVETIKAATGIGIKTLGRNAKKKAFDKFEQDAIKFYKDGKEVYYKAVGDTEFTGAFQLALAGLRPKQLDGIDKALKAFNSFQRTVITSTPGFALASIARDVGQTYVQSGTRINEVLKNNASQFQQAFTGANQATRDLMMAAGVGGYQMQGMPENDAQSFRRKVGAQSNTLWSNANKWLSNYERVLGSTELGARAAVAESIGRKGGTKGDAAYEALNMIDYNRHGASAAVQKMLYMVLFLNPRLQGLYRLFENTTGNDPKKIAAVSASVLARGLVLTGVAMAARMLSTLDDEDEEAYRNLSTSDRAQYMHIPLPGTARFLKLPQPFEIGAIFSTMPVQVFDSMYSSQNGVNDLGRMVGHTFGQTFSLNPVPQMAVPLFELYMNKSMFNGMPIEGQRLEGLPKELRIDLSTGGLAQAMGNKSLSPVQIQHLLDGYLGPLGSAVYSAVEGTVAGAGLISPKATASDGVFGGMPAPARGVANFTVGRFISKTDAERSTQFVSEFYDLANEQKQYTAAINSAVSMGDLVEARRLAEQSADRLRLKPMFAKVSRRLTEINKALRVAQFAPDMDAAERQRRIDILNVEKNRLTRAAVEAARKAGAKGGFGAGFMGRTT